MSTLQEAFQEFKAVKAALKRIHDGTVECFGRIVDGMSTPRDAELRAELETVTQSPTASPSGEDVPRSVEDVRLDLDLSNVLYAMTEQDEVQRLISQEPALIVIGQTNCGKSSIINEILGTRVLPTSDRPCTARIVRVTYAEEVYMKLQTSDGTVLEERSLKGKSKVPRKWVELRQEDREDKVKASASLVVGLNIDFLKAGVDIIDSPGKNENQVLDNLVNEQLKNVLPAIVYVVDGHNLFTSQDRTALNEITKQGRQLDIFYVVSKIDPEELLSSDEEERLSSDEEERKVERVQESKKRRVKEKLIKYGFLPAEGSTIEERLHGLSAWKINKWNQLKTKNPQWDDPDYGEYIRDFERFRQCLEGFYRESLRARIERVSSVLITVLSRCLDFFIQKANTLQIENKAIKKMLQTARHEEAMVHQAIIRDFDAKQKDIKQVIEDTIQGAKEGILKAAREFEYDAEIADLMPDGYVKTTAARDACVTQIRNMVMNKLQTEIAEKLQQMFTSKDEFAKKLEDQVRNLEKQTRDDEEAPSTAAHALAQSLVTCYDVQLEAPSTSRSLLRSFVREFVQIWKSFAVGDFIKCLNAISRRFHVGDLNWKKDIAKRQLKAIKTDEVTKYLIESLKKHFNDCHERFAEQMENMIILCERGKTVKDEQRKKIQEMAPDVAMLEMLTYSVLDSQRFGVPKRGAQLGGGAQGTVYACVNVKSPAGNPCVVKVVPISDANQLKDLALELHNTRALRHKNILPLVCTSIEGTIGNHGRHVCLVSERMKWDLHEAMLTLTTLLSLRTRLTIALEVAEALRYLHKQGMIHRDVKTQNVLLDESNHAKLTDLGLCKPEGLATCSLVGTPLNMAPEMIAKKYDKTVDVYAFGVMMWRVCEGKGNMPQNIHKHFNPIVMLYLNAVENKTPERLEEFPESCWKLMQKCWSEKPEDRPSFDIVVADLKEILEDPEIL